MDRVSPIQVLFVDDEPYRTRAYREYLKDNGFIVTYAEGASDALIASEQREFDVIVVDLMMPRPVDMDRSDTDRGLETGAWLLSKLLKLPRLSGVVFITLSNRADASDRLVNAGVSPGRVISFRKLEVPASQFPRLVLRAVESKGRPS